MLIQSKRKLQSSSRSSSSSSSDHDDDDDHDDNDDDHEEEEDDEHNIRPTIIGSNTTESLFQSIAKLESIDTKASKVHPSLSTQALAQSRAARAQVDLYADLMECRILMQKAISLLPPPEEEHHFCDTMQTEEKEVYDKILPSIDRILHDLLHARRNLLPKDDTEENDHDKDHEEEWNRSNHARRDIPEDMIPPELLQREYETCQKRWKEVLNRTYSDLQITSGHAVKAGSKFQAIDQDFWEQIQSTLNHERFLHLTNKKQKNDNGTMSTSAMETFGFDDSKVYHHMLQDFITARAERLQGSSGTTDAAAERLRRALRKKSRGSSHKSSDGGNGEEVMDRRASKGRKIRYVVHDKLVHFTYPMNRPVTMTTLGEDVLFKSLFRSSS